MRAEHRAVFEVTVLWDGRDWVLQVTGAAGGMIRLRVLACARDADAGGPVLPGSGGAGQLAAGARPGRPAAAAGRGGRARGAAHPAHAGGRSPRPLLRRRRRRRAGRALPQRRAGERRPGRKRRRGVVWRIVWDVPRTVGSVVTTLRKRLGAVLFERVAGPYGARHPRPDPRHPRAAVVRPRQPHRAGARPRVDVRGRVAGGAAPDPAPGGDDPRWPSTRATAVTCGAGSRAPAGSSRSRPSAPPTTPSSRSTWCAPSMPG